MTDEEGADKIRSNLWNDDRTSDLASLNYNSALLEQYKLYVELADRVSQRRAVANNFFLLINSAAVVFLGRTGISLDDVSPWLLVFATTILVCVCIAWFLIIKSYGQLNTAKWKVVGAMEERLPASPWWRAEWQALGAGKDRYLYWPLTHIEKWVPLVFAMLYVGMLVIALCVR